MLKDQLISVSCESAKATLAMMAATEVVIGKATKKQDCLTWGDVTGILGLTSKNFKGMFVISFEEKSILPICSNMLADKFTSIDDEVIDAVGEITNMISGKVKALLIDEGHAIEWSSPLVLVGKDVRLSNLVNSPIFQVPFKTNSGAFVIEIGYQV
jgi:chemotaxis protein CheX